MCKISQWSNKMKLLTEIAITESQTAFAAYIHGEMHKLSYSLSTIPGMEDYLEPHDTTISDQFLLPLFGTPITDLMRTSMRRISVARMTHFAGECFLLISI